MSANGSSAGPRVAVIGAGMSGICMGAKLRHAGIEDFTIYEKAGEVGGTWRENSYPGLSCDVPARFYSYSFLPNPDWSRYFAPGPEIKRYFSGAADELGVRDHIRFGAEVIGAEWKEGRWHLRIGDGTDDVVDVLVSAAGVLHHPKLPEIEGLDSFEGTSFHSARWDHSVPLAGKRVGVIGTGSTGVQIVTAVAGVPERLSVFQRTAQWIYPVPNLRYSRLSRRLLRRFPALSRLSYRAYQKGMEASFGKAVIEPGLPRTIISAICRLNLRLGVRDRELRRRLKPEYEPMCKRLVASGGFYRAMQHERTELVTTGIERIEPTGIRTDDGRLHELDVLVLATGFDAHAFVRPMELVGEDGVTLEDAWADGPRAYRTVALPGFPNFFMMLGPHSPIGNHSLVAIVETQADWVLRWIERLRRGEIASVAPTRPATDGFNDEMKRSMPETVWTTGCNSWYLGEDGVPELWPWTPERHREMLDEPIAEDFAPQPG